MSRQVIHELGMLDVLSVLGLLAVLPGVGCGKRGLGLQSRCRFEMPIDRSGTPRWRSSTKLASTRKALSLLVATVFLLYRIHLEERLWPLRQFYDFAKGRRKPRRIGPSCDNFYSLNSGAVSRLKTVADEGSLNRLPFSLHFSFQLCAHSNPVSILIHASPNPT